MAKLSFISATFVLICFAEHVNGVSIQFYRNSNFTDLFYESNSTADCNTFSADFQFALIKSIKTDTCLIVYNHRKCQSTSRKFDPDNRLGWRYYIRSFHICNENVGGPQLNVDITKYFDIFNKPDEIPDVLDSYRNICGCINVPKYVHNMTKWSINNYGNELLAYYEPDCLENQWKSDLIPGGHWESAQPYLFYVKTNKTTNIRYKIQSLGPDPKSKYFNISCNHSKTMVISNLPAKDQSLKSLTLIIHNHDLEVTKRISKIEQENQNLSTKFFKMEQEILNLSRNFSESEFRLRKIEDKIQQLDEFQNLTIKIKNDLKQLFA